MIPTLLGISLITFMVMKMMPGDPAVIKARMAAGGNMQEVPPETLERIRKTYGLDKSLGEQYVLWLGRMVTLDFGESLVDREPVTKRILERLPTSLQLSVGSLLLAYMISVPIGVMSAVKKDSFLDQATTFGLFVLYSLPGFWLATLALVFLCGGDYFKLFPSSGLSSMGAENLPFGSWVMDRIWHLALPLAVLTYPSLAALSRYSRSGMLEVIQQDYIRTARAKGLRENAVIFVHGLRNSLIPIITLLAFELPSLLGGSMIIETIFSISGMGELTLTSITSRDYTMIMGIFTISAFLTLAGFLLGDILYCVADPRIRLQ